MMYSIISPYLPFAAEAVRCGNNADNGLGGMLSCSECGAALCPGEEYYDVCGSIYCMDCQAKAERHILDEIRENYIFEL